MSQNTIAVKKHNMNEIMKFLEWATCGAGGALKQLSTAIVEASAALVKKPPLCTGYNYNLPRDTAQVLDVSGSMGNPDYPPTRIDGGINASTEYVDTRIEQCPNDRISVVSFNSTAQIVLPLTPITDKKTIIGAMRNLTAGGGTDIAEGLKAAAEIFDKEPKSNRQRHIIVLTDGHGGRPLKIAGKLKTEYGAVINVVGIAASCGDVNESLLRKVATTDPDGFCHYRFIKDAETLSEHYRQLATGIVWHRERK